MLKTKLNFPSRKLSLIQSAPDPRCNRDRENETVIGRGWRGSGRRGHLSWRSSLWSFQSLRFLWSNHRQVHGPRSSKPRTTFWTNSWIRSRRTTQGRSRSSKEGRDRRGSLDAEEAKSSWNARKELQPSKNARRTSSKVNSKSAVLANVYSVAFLVFASA